jgi:hypothetical protein
MASILQPASVSDGIALDDGGRNGTHHCAEKITNTKRPSDKQAKAVMLSVSDYKRAIPDEFPEELGLSKLIGAGRLLK